VGCGRAFSFPSAHAANHFGISFYLMPFFASFGTLPKILLFVWAAIVAYAQVYVGVHYPVDVLTGAFLGASIGFGISILFKKITHWDTSYLY
jgi:undecaprenyl-diphosphatase